MVQLKVSDKYSETLKKCQNKDNQIVYIFTTRLIIFFPSFLNVLFHFFKYDLMLARKYSFKYWGGELQKIADRLGYARARGDTRLI